MDNQHEPANVGQRAKLPDLEDFTKLGGYKKSTTKRRADKDSDKESRDTKHDDFSEFSHKDDDERHRQPIFKGIVLVEKSFRRSESRSHAICCRASKR